VILARKPSPATVPTADLRAALGAGWGPYLHSQQTVTEEKRLHAVCAEYGVRPIAGDGKPFVRVVPRTSLVPGVPSDRRLLHADGELVIWERPYAEAVSTSLALDVALRGTGALNIDACRVGATVETWPVSRSYGPGQIHPGGVGETQPTGSAPPGRWPANLLLSHAPGCRKVGNEQVKATSVKDKRGTAHWNRDSVRDDVWSPNYADADGLETVEVWECVEGCPVRALGEQSQERPGMVRRVLHSGRGTDSEQGYSDHGTAARFFTTFEPEEHVPFLYCPKANRAERDAGLGPNVRSVHPTVKPLAVIEWLLRLTTRECALVLDPFLGSGTTAVACIRLGRRWAGAEITEEYWPIIEARVAHAQRTAQPELDLGGDVA